MIYIYLFYFFPHKRWFGDVISLFWLWSIVTICHQWWTPYNIVTRQGNGRFHVFFCFVFDFHVTRTHVTWTKFKTNSYVMSSIFPTHENIVVFSCCCCCCFRPCWSVFICIIYEICSPQRQRMNLIKLNEMVMVRYWLKWMSFCCECQIASSRQFMIITWCSFQFTESSKNANIDYGVSYSSLFG